MRGDKSKMFKPRVIASEAQEQTALFRWKSYNENLIPGLNMLHAIPNGGKRDPAVGAQLKAQGVQAGVPDISLPVPRGEYHGMYIELKVGGNKPTKKQEDWLGRLADQGYKTAVCYGWVQAAEAIMEYLKSGKTA